MINNQQIQGERAYVAERLVVAPVAGLFRPLVSDDRDNIDGCANLVELGQEIGMIEAPGSSTPVSSPFKGELMGMLAEPGERLREGQPVAWLRVA